MKFVTLLDYEGKMHCLDAEKIIDIEEVNKSKCRIDANFDEKIKTIIYMQDKVVISLKEDIVNVVKYFKNVK